MPRRIAPVEEVFCRLRADGRLLRVFRCTPGDYEELIAGWLVGSGVLTAGQLASLPTPLVTHQAGGARVEVELPPDRGAEPAPADVEDCDRLLAPLAAPARTPAPLPPAELRPELLRRLYEGAERYRDTGGVHAAALFRDGEMVAHAEDVGRHNAVDRVIGQALLAGLPPERLGLVLSARVSGEIALKAARTGLAWVASRSLPTTLAVRVAERARLPIIARAGTDDATVFGGPGGPANSAHTPGAPLGVILAGGRNRRFGGEIKALERVAGERIVERAAAALARVSARVVMVVNDPESYASVELEQRPDVSPGAGPLAGVHTALCWAADEGRPGVLVAACDMPFVSADLLARLWRLSADADGAVPESEGPRGVEPLCAAYRVSCLPAVESAIERDDLRIVGFHEQVNMRRLPLEQVRTFGAPERLFMNVNTPEDLALARARADAAREPA